MTRVNVNTASREELVDVAGLRPEIADEVLKLRRKGRIASAEALREVPGVGPATLEQAREALDFGAPAGNGDGRGREGTASRTTAEAGGSGAEAGGSGAEAAASVAYGGLETARRAIGVVGEAQREAARRSTEGAAEVGWALMDVVQEQVRHNLEALTALTGTVDWDRATGTVVDWDRVLRIQGELLRASAERSARLAERYLEVTQAVMAAAAATAAGRDGTGRAA